MELKKYKLGDVADIVNGATPSTHNSENYDGSIIWITPKDLSGQKQKIIRRGQRNISEIGFNNCSAQMIPPYNILMSSRAPIGLLAINENECCLNSATVSINRLSDSKLSLWCLGALFDCCISRDKPFHPLTPPSDLRQYAVENRQEIRISQSLY